MYADETKAVEERAAKVETFSGSARSRDAQYNMGHLMIAACLHHRAAAKTSLLTIAERAVDCLHAERSSGCRSSGR